MGSHRLFFFGRCCVILHCHQQLWGKQIICTLLELGRDFMWWGRKEFAVNWATCGAIPGDGVFLGKPPHQWWVWIRIQQRSVREGLTSSESFSELGIVAVGCSACLAAGFQWSAEHQGDYGAAKRQHFKIKPFTVRSQLLHPPSPSESSTFLLQGTRSWGALLAINLVVAPAQSPPSSLGLMKSSSSTAVHVACNYCPSIRSLWCKFKNSSGKPDFLLNTSVFL